MLAWRGSSKDREAFVRWKGIDEDTGLPWPDSWVPRRFLTVDLRADGAIRRRPDGEARRQRSEGEASGASTVSAGWRKSPRLAGKTPVEGIR